MNLTAVTSRAAAALVAAVAGFASYSHIVAVATRAGEHQAVAVVLPLSIDGLIVVGTMAMIEDKRGGRIPRLSARVALGFGIVATLAANVASAEPTTTARCVAAIPALAFLIAVEVLARSGKPLPEVTPEPASATPPVTVTVTPEPPPVDPWDYATPIGPAPVTVTPAAAPVDAKPRPIRAAKKSTTTAEKVARAAAKLPAGTVAQIAAKAGVSESTARRYMPATVTSAAAPDPAAMRVNGTPLVEVTV